MIAISPSDICQSLHTAAPGGGVTLNEPDTVGVYNCPIRISKEGYGLKCFSQGSLASWVEGLIPGVPSS